MNIGRFYGVRIEDQSAEAYLFGLNGTLCATIDGTTDHDIQTQVNVRLDEVCEAQGITELKGVCLMLYVTRERAAYIIVQADELEDSIDIPVQLTKEEVAGIVSAYAIDYAQRLKEVLNIQ